MRIPLAIHRADTRPSRPTRPCTTVDVAATIRDWFGVAPHLFPTDGVSLTSSEVPERALCFVRRDHEGVARAISFTATRKDIFEISTTMEVTWVASFEVDAAGVVTTRTVTPDDPGALAAEIEEYCGNRSCPD